MGGNVEPGAAAVRRAGGRVFVQSLSEAEYASVPRHALAIVEPDACLPAAEIAPRLAASGRPLSSAA